MYSRKGYYTINVQAICDADRRFRWFDMRGSGNSCHDSTAFNNSPLCALFDTRRRSIWWRRSKAMDPPPCQRQLQFLPGRSKYFSTSLITSSLLYNVLSCSLFSYNLPSCNVLSYNLFSYFTEPNQDQYRVQLWDFTEPLWYLLATCTCRA